MSNNTKIHLTPEEFNIVKTILNKYKYSFYAFGSRVKGNIKKFSDLDLMYKDDIPLHILNEIKNDFEESNLPFKVDIVAKSNCSKEFLEIITKDLILIMSTK
jgi:uncharacterized protein